MGKKLLVALTMEGKFAGEDCRTLMKTMTCSPLVAHRDGLWLVSDLRR
jgi:hypothetical protein